MWRYRGRALVVSAAAAVCLAAVAVSHAATAAAGASLLKVRLGGDAAQTRVVIDLERSATAKVVSDGSADGRVILLLPGVEATGVQQGAGQGLVRTWVVDQTSGGARLQMDIAAGSKVKRRFLLPPADGVEHYRYVVDVAAMAPNEVRLVKASPPPAPILRPRMTAAKAPLPLKKVIVIDAGHGGQDPGARGAVGFEKDVNLAAARALRDQLERTGRYKVVMTRDADLYVALESRVRVAQRADADLFISLHSDSGPDASLSGASVYTLSDKATRRSTQFVSKDDWFMKASSTGDRGVSDILLDLTQRATRNRSSAFAQMVVSSIEGQVPLLSRSHRDAGFMVLLAPDVPAVLLEMGFISNQTDERLLSDPQRRTALMGSVAGAIDGYFGEPARLAAR